MEKDSGEEQNKLPGGGFCGRHSITGRLDGPGGPRYRVARLRCKSWTCPTCGKKRARKLKSAIVEQAELHHMDKFVTLTMDPSKGTAEESWDQIKAVWALARVYLGREFGAGFKYLWVVEAQKNGYAHLHILVNQYVPQAWLKQVWDRLGGGRIVHIERVNIRRTGPYLAKYLTKGFDAGLKQGQRRYGSSRVVKLGGVTGPKTGVWIMVKAPIELLRSRVLQGVEFTLEGVLEGFESLEPPMYIPPMKPLSKLPVP